MAMNKYDKAHMQNLVAIERQIEAIYQSAIREAARLGVSLGEIKPDKVFSFADYPVTKGRVDKLLQGLKNRLYTCIVNGINAEWTLSNNKNNELARQVFGDNVGKLSQQQYRRYFSTNDGARKAFIQRKTNGLKLSDRVWNYTTGFQREIELGLDVGIRNGMSAADMTKELGLFLKHPDKLFRRVRDEHGNLNPSKRASEFHPGRGVYRSSYMNARRLAATETNIAYRTSDYLRWQDMDFVVGIRVVMSNNHTCRGRDGKPHPFIDICDELSAPLNFDKNSKQGCYPKNFKFTGWHPHCRCFATSILKTQEEIDRDTQHILNGEPTDGESVNRVRDVPQAFNDWVADNKERAKGWSSMPYFIRNNPQYIQGFEVDTYSPVERVFTRAGRTNEAMAESLGVFLQSRYPEIPNTEKAAIYHYTQGNRAAYRQLNNQLRRGNLSEFNAAFSELLSDGLTKIPPVEATVYRTIRLNKTRLRDFYGKATTQAETVFDGFTSTSFERSTVMDFAAAHMGRKNNETDVLLIIQGKSGHPIEDFSQFGGRFAGKRNQREVLFDKGCKFRFDRMEIEDGCPVFYLTEI